MYHSLLRFVMTHRRLCSYKEGRKLNGIIFLQRISDYRMGGVARKNFRLFRKLCGDDTLKNVVIVTNMWSDVSSEVGEKRERELSGSELFFKPALEKGAHMVRHDNTVASAHRIIREIIGFPPTPLQIQVETVDEHKTLAQTDAGQDLKDELERQAAKHKQELDGLRSEMEELLSTKDAQHKTEIDELNDALRDVQGQLDKVEGEARQLREEHELSRKEHAEKMRLMAESMAEREAELRTLQTHARKQTAKVEELEKALREAEEKAVAEENHRVKADEDLKTTNAVYQEELERMRKDFEEKLEAGRRESLERESAQREALKRETEAREAAQREALKRETEARETAKREAEARRETPKPQPARSPNLPRPVTQNRAQERWAYAYTATQQRRGGFFSAISIAIDQLFGSSR